MKTIAYLWINLWLTLLRVLPFPCQTGLVRIGAPGRDSPVLLTGNYRLTVVRVRYALRGLDAWLLVANSRGVNIWCAATGGLLSNHDVISVVKTSGIERQVDHRELILPQLVATGIEERAVQEKTGWQVQWGPVEAAAVPAWLAAGREKSPAMQRVTFPWRRRLELAVAWAFPFSLLVLPLLPLWPESVWPLTALVWGMSLAMFLSFPLYEQRLRSPARPVGWIFFNFGPRGVLLIFWVLFLAALVIYGVMADEFSWPWLARWALASLIVIQILGLDLTGSTPTYKSGLHADRRLRISLDTERCKGVGRCEAVCPSGVFEIDHRQHLATLPGIDRCVQCGACIVQCPCDALSFRGEDGNVVTPETVRRFKLNLLGNRMVRRDNIKNGSGYE